MAKRDLFKRPLVAKAHHSSGEVVVFVTSTVQAQRHCD
jgi:hypothetical protein